MKKLLIGILGFSLFAAGLAFAQSVPGARLVTALSGAYSFNINTRGPQSAVVPFTVGTFTCNGATPDASH